MKRSTEKSTHKRPINLALSKGLVAEAKGKTGKGERRMSVAEEARATVAVWNEVAERNGSFADHHSTL